MDKTEKYQIIKDLKALLKNRRVVFFSMYPNPEKQQKILVSENVVSLLEMQIDDETRFIKNLKKLAKECILPLVPKSNSRMYNWINSIYTKINSIPECA